MLILLCLMQSKFIQMHSQGILSIRCKILEFSYEYLYTVNKHDLLKNLHVLYIIYVQNIKEELFAIIHF